MNRRENYKFVEPKKDVEIHLSNGKVISGPRGSTLEEFLDLLEERGLPPIVGAVVNGKLTELSYSVEMDVEVHPITMESADGMRFYRRSLIFLLETAFSDLFPDAILTVDHSVTSGGYFCQVYRRSPLSDEELGQLEDRMRELVSANIPFERLQISLEEGIEYFRKLGYNDKVRLLAHRKKDYLTLYKLGERMDYHHGYMVPSTGYLKWFDLVPMEDGFLIRYPRRKNPTILQPLSKYSSLLNVFKRYGGWLHRLGIDSVGALNDSIAQGHSRKLILVSEALHEQRITEIAAQIEEKSAEIDVILIAGPSSSGKTTFSKRLTIQLLARGINPFPLEMDKYFVDRDNTPKDENGEWDFEALEAVNRKKLSSDLLKLIKGEEVQLPKYDFQTGTSGKGEIVHLRPGQIIIVEGIHGLNPNLLPEFPQSSTFRIYVSALTQLNLDRHNRVSTTDTRLIRRIVRDSWERGYSAMDTINRWESVRRGEKENIFPFQDYADVMFNSALVYELAALKPLAEPLLRQVPHSSLAHIEAKRLLAFLEWFLPLEIEMIPDNSILREFIGNSILKDFNLWEQ
ncbi:MAG: nucleoside kinase [Chloroflexi bacterium]|nr:MAG: nucleoside kinase [Chloroflexota bacterium]